MQPINKTRMLLGGLVAGLVVNVCEGIAHGFVLAQRDAAMMTRLNLPPEPTAGKLIALNVWGFAVGILAIVLYAAIRPRMGAGPSTAIFAGVLTWAGTSALSAAIPAIMGIYELDLTLINVGFELVVFTLAAVAGAAVYKEEAVAKSSAASA